MDAREKEIHFLEAEILEAEKKGSAQLADIGRTVIALAPSAVTSDDLARNLEKARAIEARSTKAKEDVDRIRNRVDRLAQIRTALQENDKKIADAHREVEARHGEVGTAAYEAYKTRCTDKERFRDLFAEILAIDDKKQKLEEEITGLRAGGASQGFFTDIANKAKVEAKKIEQKMKDLGRKPALTACGRRVLDSEFGGAVQDGTLTDLLAAVNNHRKLAVALQEESTALRAEQKKLEEDLRGLGAAEGHEKRVRDLETDAQAAQVELAALAAAVGQVVYEQKLHEALQSEHVASLAQAIQGLRKDIEERRQKIERLRAQIELDRVGTEMDGYRARRAELEAKIKGLQGEIEGMNAQLETLGQKQESLRKIAGVESPAP
ncbi:MAG: hypothetical protein HYZ53_22620 [Planctomycetes bacterium]|nr:hypothetical protein [Planctomycetota bacterium]